MLNTHDGSGTALGPYTSADLARAHIADLVAEADRDRLLHEATLASDRRAKPAVRLSEKPAPRSRRHWHWHWHGHGPAAHPA